MTDPEREPGSGGVGAERAIRRVSFHTLGCKLNQAETDALAALFRRRGYEVVPFREDADLAIINTCTVTGEADAKSRQVIRQAVQASPWGRVAAVGCYAQVGPREVAALEGVDLVLGTREKHQVLDLLKLLEGGRLDKPLVRVGDTAGIATYDETPFISAAAPSGPDILPGAGRTRAFLKVQDGCDYNCSYCIVPLARGRGRGRPLADCLAEARRLLAEGYREIVLTGVNIGTWQEDDRRLHHLLAALSAVDGLRRIRLSSIEPNLLSDDILRLVAEQGNIAPHFHLPLQHASDRVLRAMRRRYRMADYRAVIARITAAIPDAAIGADVIVGFPGETEDDFRQLAAALTDLPLTYHHIFRYSERAGTVASRMTGAVDPAVRKRRSALLREISRKRRREVARRALGQTRLVHFERSGDGCREGLTDNYLRVRVPASGQPGDPFQPVTLTGYNDSILYGRPAA